MQLGTRWSVGDAPPTSLTDEHIARIRASEAELPTEDRSLRWTLTWLEGRPVVELDNGLIVTEPRAT